MRHAIVAAALLSVMACGKGSPTAPAPFNQTVNGTVSSVGYTQHAMNVSRAGTLTLSLTWQGTADLDLYLTSTGCADLYPSAGCPRLALSDNASGSTETITRTVASGENFKVWVDNLTFSPQNYTLTVNIK
jgi:hypothetical protein